MNIFYEKRIKGSGFSFSGNIFDDVRGASQKIFIMKTFICIFEMWRLITKISRSKYELFYWIFCITKKYFDRKKPS